MEGAGALHCPDKIQKLMPFRRRTSQEVNRSVGSDISLPIHKDQKAAEVVRMIISFWIHRSDQVFGVLINTRGGSSKALAAP